MPVQLTRLIPESVKRKVKKRLKVPDMEARVEHLASLDFNPRHAIDIGAYQGEWTQCVKRYFPETRILMVEPQSGKVPDLQRVAAGYADVTLKESLLSSKEGTLHLYEQDSNTRIVDGEDLRYLSDHDPDNLKQVKATTLSQLIHGSEFAQAELIKLDVQGHELDILAGAQSLLPHVQVIILEISLLKLGPHPLALQTLQQMDDYGFQLYDLCDFINRPYDNALYQVNGVFMRSSSPLVNSRRWA